MSKVFTDQIPPAGGRRYSIAANPDGTSSITDVTQYVQEGTPWGADDANNTVRKEDWNASRLIPATITYTPGTFEVVADIPAPQTRATVMGYTSQPYASGDTMTINGTPVTLTDLTGEPLSDGAWGNDSGLAVPVQLMIDLSGATKRAFFKTGGISTPGIFGDGSDGDFYLYNNQTHIEPVPIPHQSIVIKQYKTFVMEPGSTYKCDAHNAGLFILVQKYADIKGTIDQSGLAPKTNPDNNYPYPAQLVCGDGGNGGNGGTSTGYGAPGEGGIAMLKRPYGGGWGAGGGGSPGRYNTTTPSDQSRGGDGGSTSNITIDVNDAQLWIGGPGGNPSVSPRSGGDGINGGGGGGGAYNYNSATATGGIGGTGPGGNGAAQTGGSSGGKGGGAGNYGGGVLLLYVGGKLTISGSIRCNGLNGGNSTTDNQSVGGGGGGGGGGAIYIYYGDTYVNTGLLQVAGGLAGVGGNSAQAGGVGSITIVQHAA